MDYSEGFLGSLFENMLNSFAYHKIITDENGKPIDYIYLDVNHAFETIVGIKKEDLIGKSVKTISPQIVEDSFNWIDFYGEVALENTAPTTEQYSEALNKWLLINAFSPEKGYFVSIIMDITEIKNRDINISEKNTELNRLYSDILTSEQEIKRQMIALESIQQTLLENEKRADIAQRIAHIGHWDYDLRDDIFWGSEGAFNLFGLKRENPSVKVETFKDIILLEDREQLKNHFRGLLSNHERFDKEFKIIRRNDSSLRFLHSIAELTFDSEGNPIKVIGAILDITERIEYENQLKSKNEELTVLYEEIYETDEILKKQLDELNKHKAWLELSELRYRTLVDNSNDAIYSCDINGVFTAVNNQFCQFIDLKKEEIIGKKMNEFLPIYDESFKEWHTRFMAVINYGKTLTFENKFDRDGDTICFHITLSPILDSKGEIIGITGTNHDITSIKKNEDKIKHMAYHDPLTNLPNRLLFYDRLTNAINQSKRTKLKIAVLFFDMDNFKRINDTLGHSIGDELLVETGIRITSCMREYDTVARLSGDEFAVLLQNIERNEDMLSIISRIQQKFSLPFFLTDNTIELSTSIGIAMYPEDGNTPEELLKNADTAMYKAKEQGRNKYLFFHFTMKEDVVKKVRIEKLLKRAVRYREFVLYYQPQFFAKDLSLRGFEALIRWNSPELGFVSPKDFISIAEENGQIIEIGEWVIQEACYMLKKMKEKYEIDLKMSINLSLLQLRQKDFDQLVLSYMHYYKLEPHDIELEVTEGHFIDHYDVALNVLKKLKKHGFGIALDDFGTGYSSLSYLKKLPINMLKIDQAFVKEIDPNKPENDLTEPIISLVHKLGIETTAEGVETREQMNYLINSKCDYLQGYYLGRPVPRAEAEKIIKESLQ